MRYAGVAVCGLLVFLQPGTVVASAAPGQRVTIFHLDGITEDIARGDILSCVSIAREALSGRSKSGSDYGLVGTLLGQLLGEGPTNRMRNATIQKCMTVHGYRLYNIEQERWVNLIGADTASRIKFNRIDSIVIDGLARIASQPLPAKLAS